MIGIIEYSAGNAPSVLNAMQHMNLDAGLITNPGELDRVSGIILPGVGSAKATMDSLSEMDLIPKLHELVNRRHIPFMGICIGLQVLFEFSEEDQTPCLGWLKGCVKKFSGLHLRVPQIGWNTAAFTKEDPVLSGISQTDYFYFVNSYYVVPDDPDIILAKTGYGSDFCSMVKNGNIYAAQFHLEKSGEAGLRILRNFAYEAEGKKC